MVPEQTYRAWEQQHAQAARSRKVAEDITRQRLVEARIRLEKALRAVEILAALDAMT